MLKILYIVRLRGTASVAETAIALLVITSDIQSYFGIPFLVKFVFQFILHCFSNFAA
jgi:hypothetical protein